MTIRIRDQTDSVKQTYIDIIKGLGLSYTPRVFHQDMDGSIRVGMYHDTAPFLVYHSMDGKTPIGITVPSSGPAILKPQISLETVLRTLAGLVD